MFLRIRALASLPAAFLLISSAAATNIVVNGGFESGLDCWSNLSAAPGFAEVRTLNGAHSGTQYLYVDSGPENAGGRGLVRQDLPGIRSEDVLSLTVWARNTDTAHRPRVILGLVPVPFAPVQAMLSGTDWTQATITGAQIPDGLTLTYVMIDSSIFGHADVDDIVIDVVYAAGDMNCDHLVNNFDIDAFVAALTDPAAYAAAFPHCAAQLADVNADGHVDNFDIDVFVQLLAH